MRLCSRSEKNPGKAGGYFEKAVREGTQNPADVPRRGKIRTHGAHSALLAPAGTRPEVPNGYVREYTYAYGAVSPNEGTLEWMLCQKMNTQHMGEFLSQVGKAHADEFVVMVADGASSHVSKTLEIPENVRLRKLPAYSPQLNPQENIWDEMREKYFPNRVFSNMTTVRRQLLSGFGELATDQFRLHSITAWPWIKNIILKES
jgi:hypothetical protein